MFRRQVIFLFFSLIRIAPIIRNMAIIRPNLTYGREVWPLTGRIE